MISLGARLTVVAPLVLWASELAASRDYDSPAPLLVQLDWVQAAWAPLIQREAFARLPEFTLYADGTVVYIADPAPGPDPDSYLTATLTTSEAAGIRKHVLDLGFASLETDTTFSTRSPDPPNVVTERGNDSIISMRMDDDELRTVRNNGFWANYPDTLKAIYEYLALWSSPKGIPYEPHTATVAVDSHWKAVRTADPVAPVWPLKESLVSASPSTKHPGGAPFIIDGAQYATLMHTAEPWLRGRMSFSQGEFVYLVVVRPWLPGEDFTAPLESFRAN